MDKEKALGILEGIISDINSMMQQTRASRLELRDLEQEIETLYQTGKMTDITYAIHKERTHRASQNIDDCV